MIKPQNLKKGDKVAIVSLSRGILGAEFCKHELELGLKRLKEYGLEPVIMPHALDSMDTLEAHPEYRASDLKEAFMDESIKGIITAIGGNDTYKTIPYLMDDPEFIEAVKNNPKIFTGFSDTTNNHLMLNRIGLSTFYGPCFIVDIAELDKEMLPYTKEQFELYFESDAPYEIKSSPIWYSDRESFGEDQLGVPRKANQETHGYEILNGSGVQTGKLYGGCIDSFYDAFTGEAFADEPAVHAKYNIMPTEEEWKEKILFIEPSEVAVEPEKLEQMLMEFKNRNIFKSVKGVIVGKPYNEKYYEEYKEKFKKVFADLDTPVLYNVNFGHAFPRCVIPYDAEATIDYDNKKIIINTPILEKRSSTLTI